jgi:hypothetical protein
MSLCKISMPSFEIGFFAKHVNDEKIYFSKNNSYCIDRSDSNFLFLRNNNVSMNVNNLSSFSTRQYKEKKKTTCNIVK